MRSPLPLLVIAASAMLVAQTRSGPQFRDKSGSFAISYSEMSTTFPDKETINFEVSGNPVKGYSRNQNLEFSSSQMSGTLKKNKQGEFFLVKGAATGNATLTIADQKGKSVIKSAKVTLDDNGQSATVTIPNAFSFTNSVQGEAGTRQLDVKGTRGSIVLKSLAVKDDNPLVSAEIVGPVEVKVDQLSSGGRRSVYTLTGERVSMRAEGTDKVMTVSGNVHLTSDQTDPESTGMIGDFTAGQATVVFDKDYEIKKVSTKGSPAQGTLKDKKDGS